MQKHHKTIVISDVHLGSKWSKTKEATRFLKDNTCETLILCGDIIDGWAILRGKKAKWKRRHTNFIKTLLDISHTTQIVYVRGNHDDFLDRIVPIEFMGMSIVRDWIYESLGKRYFVLHGDVFDRITSTMSWLSRLGDVGYSMLLWISRSLADKAKKSVKRSVAKISDFEKNIVEIARHKGCDGVICGHIHSPEIREIEGVLYLNSGDWVESLSALTQDHQGNWAIYKDTKEEQ